MAENSNVVKIVVISAAVLAVVVAAVLLMRYFGPQGPDEVEGQLEPVIAHPTPTVPSPAGPTLSERLMGVTLRSSDPVVRELVLVVFMSIVSHSSPIPSSRCISLARSLAADAPYRASICGDCQPIIRVKSVSGPPLRTHSCANVCLNWCGCIRSNPASCERLTRI